WLGFWLTVGMTFVGALVQAAQAANLTSALTFSGGTAGRTSLFNHTAHLLLLARLLNPAPGSPVRTLLFETRYGQVWFGRILLLGLLAFVLVRLRATRRLPDRRTRLVWYVAAALAAL